MTISHYKGLIERDLGTLRKELTLREHDERNVQTNAHREFCRREVGRLRRLIAYLEHYQQLVERLNEMPRPTLQASISS